MTATDHAHLIWKAHGMASACRAEATVWRRSANLIRELILHSAHPDYRRTQQERLDACISTAGHLDAAANRHEERAKRLEAEMATGDPAGVIAKRRARIAELQRRIQHINFSCDADPSIEQRPLRDELCQLEEYEHDTPAPASVDEAFSAVFGNGV